MGNVPSSYFEEKIEDHFWSKCASTGNADAKSSTSQNLASATRNLSQTAPKEISEANKEKLSEFKLELARKHEKRRDIIAGKRMEMDTLRKEIEKLKKENEELKTHTSKEIYQDQEEIERLRRENEEIDNLRKENEELKCLLKEKSLMLEESERIIDKNRELRISIAELQTELQRLNKEVMNFEKEREDYRVHVVALKDVISVSKHMLQLRESQLKELKEKVESIEQSLASREATILSQDLRAEYEKQITNMRNLRLLYEERQRAERREREEIASQLAEANKELELQQKKNGEHETRINELELENSKKYDQIKALESSLGLSKAENRQYQAELAVINQLFSETLLKYNTSQEIDLDKLQKHLEEHHGLLKDIVVNEVSSEVSYALPKVLLELINQLHENEEIVNEEGVVDDNQSNQLHPDSDQESPNTATRHEMSSAEEIVENLPKVWRVLIELLSHQIVPTNTLTNDKDDEDEDPCYKRIETPKGPSLVLSVSQTFIRLKDLILEKKSLEKETANLKHLNCHLENRLQDQEKRLELVHNELSKTWLVVGKLQKQHQMLHTQEKILRYELAQKRKLLNELKEELEYSREKWAQAREKNSNTELQWRQLRTEFANRRNTTTEDNNNSAESGYSDDREGLSDEEPGYETDVSECAQKTGEDTENQDLEVEELSEDIANENLETTTENSNLERIEEQNANKNSSETSVESSSLGNIEVQNANKNNSETSVESSSLGNIEVQNANENPDDDHIVSSTSDIEKTSSTGNNTDEEEFTKVKSQTTSDLEDVEVQTSLGAHLETTTESSNLGNTTVQQPEDLCAVSSTSSIEQTSSTVVEELTKDKCDGGTDKTEKIRNADSSLLECLPSTSSTKLEDSRKRFEEMIAKKEERLKRLESQAESLVNITANTASRSVEICNKLDDLHEAFGQSTDHQESRRSRENEENVTGEESTKVNEDSNSSVDDSDGGDK